MPTIQDRYRKQVQDRQVYIKEPCKPDGQHQTGFNNIPVTNHNCHRSTYTASRGLSLFGCNNGFKKFKNGHRMIPKLFTWKWLDNCVGIYSHEIPCYSNSHAARSLIIQGPYYHFFFSSFSFRNSNNLNVCVLIPVTVYQFNEMLHAVNWLTGESDNHITRKNPCLVSTHAGFNLQHAAKTKPA